ncbi:MAG: hypothetical protein K6A80_05480 [Saccharofermentans sp.]|nr:hypothetical protein [Saccharofermentans sp.]
MRKFLCLFLSIVLMFGIAGCQSDESAPPDDDEQEQDEFGIGIAYHIGGTDDTVEFWSIAGSEDKVGECGTNVVVTDFDAARYSGMTYCEAFIDFYRGALADRNGEFTSVSFIIDESADWNEIRPNAEELRNELFPGTEFSFVTEPFDRFTEFIRDSHQRYYEDGTTPPAGVTDPAESFPETDSDGNYIIRSQDDFDKLVNVSTGEGLSFLSISEDMDLLITRSDARFCIICHGHALALRGNIEYPVQIRVEGASEVDLQGLVISEFRRLDLRENAEYLVVTGTPADQITLPDGLNDLRSGEERNRFAQYDGYEFSDDSGELRIISQGPEESYDEVHETDLAVINAILTTGDYSSIWSGGAYCIRTDVDIDIGNTVLPNTDYAHIILDHGAHLRMTGTMTITGGRFEFEVCEYDQLDLTGLTIVKRHPSPDMIKIRFNPGVGINRSSVTLAGASNGSINYSYGSESIDISVW